jgi:hypothetical protein
MAIQIDRMETSVEVTAPTARPNSDRGSRIESPGSTAALRDTVMQLLSDELANYRRMRGH